ncbi:MAG: 4-hydroxyphenylpyruvate dioxygenase [Candidatus Berkiella sp.]
MKTELRSHTQERPSNTMQLDGFEFVEFASANPQQLETLFHTLGFTPIAQHKTQDIILYRQNNINFLLNKTTNSYASTFHQAHGPCACSMAFRVKDAKFAYERAIKLGAKSATHASIDGWYAIYGIGDSLLYFIDQYSDNKNIYDPAFNYFENIEKHPKGAGLNVIDHLTHNVHQGEMDTWAEFYEKIFNFYEIRYFDIEGKMTGLTSRALSSPCGKIKIPLNQSKDNVSQIEEYLREYKGEGIQHIALTTDNIYQSVEQLRSNQVNFLSVPATYYEALEQRIPGHKEDVARMKKNHLLIDGSVQSKEGLLLQIFTENVIGPIFFEIIQRKGNEGFGEGNFTALFEAIERDQIRRGVLTEKA